MESSLLENLELSKTINNFEAKKLKIEIKRGILYIEEMVYNNRDIIFGTIKGEKTEGRIYYDFRNSNQLYFLQNIVPGSQPGIHNLSGFKYGWSFCPKSSGEGFDSDVKLVNYKADDSFNIKELEDKYPLPKFQLNSYKNYTSSKGGGRNYFTVQEIPKCCGATLLYDFQADSIYDQSIYDKLTKDEVIEFNNFIGNILNSNKIAYLLKKTETWAINFLTDKCNFKIINEFTNKNTKNVIQILSRNDEVK